MTEQNPTQNNDDILAAFVDALDDMVPDNREEIDRILQRYGLDPDEVRSETQTMIAELRARSPLDWRNKGADLERERARYEEAGSGVPSDRSSLLTWLHRLLDDADARRLSLSTQYRNQNEAEMSDEELRSLVQDLRFVLENSNEHGSET